MKHQKTPTPEYIQEVTAKGLLIVKKNVNRKEEFHET